VAACSPLGHMGWILLKLSGRIVLDALCVWEGEQRENLTGYMLNKQSLFLSHSEKHQLQQQKMLSLIQVLLIYQVLRAFF
jgi:hypothetical protein